MRAVADRVVFPRFVITTRTYAVSWRFVSPSIAKNASRVMTIVFTRGVSWADITRPGTTTSWRIMLATRAEIATLIAISHAKVDTTMLRWTMPRTPFIPTAAAIMTPTMPTAIHGNEMGTTEIEISAMGIPYIDGETPKAIPPYQRAIEIAGGHISVVLPTQQDIAQVQIALCPTPAIEVIIAVDAHQVVQVDFVGGLVLVIGEIEFIGHLVGQEQRVFPCLLVAHGVGLHREGEQGGQDGNHLFHRRMFLCFQLLSLC